MSSYVGKVSAASEDHFVASTAYGTCATAAATAAKAVLMDGFDTLLTGVTIHVLFQNSNTAENPTLNVNGTGDKPIYIAGIASPGMTAADSWDANAMVSFTYDGSAWRMNDAEKTIRDSLHTVEQIVGDGTLAGFAATDLTGAVNELMANLPSNAVAITATAAGWSSETPPTQTIAVTGVTATNNIVVSVASTITSTQYDAACDGKLVCTGQAAGNITLTAYGIKPAVNIPMSVVILG